VGDLAESWTTSPDGTEWTFKLRQGVKWQGPPAATIQGLNGREFTSDDVKFSLEEWKKAPGLESMFSVISMVDAPDKSTVKLGLSKPAGYLLALLAENRIMILPKEIKDQKGDFKSAAVGTGPMILKEAVKGSKYVFQKNPDYFIKGQPYLDGYTINIVTDAAAQRAGFRAGQYYWTAGDSVTPTEMQALVRSNSDTVWTEKDTTAGRAIWHIAMRADKEPFNKVEVRRALSMAIDRKAIIQAAFEGKGLTMHALPYTLVQDKLPTLDDFGPYYKYNPTEARKLLQQAGVPDGVEWELAWYPYGANIEQIVQLVQSQMKPAGVNIKLNKPGDIASFTALYQGGKFENLAYGFIPTFPVDPALAMWSTLHSGLPGNYSKYNDPKLDKMTEDLLAAKPENQKPIYKQLWDYMLDQAIIPGIAEQIVEGYHSPKLHNTIWNYYNENFHYGGAASAVWWVDK
jgi:peptide/nickel transport system substrate-binding protein